MIVVRQLHKTIIGLPNKNIVLWWYSLTSSMNLAGEVQPSF